MEQKEIEEVLEELNGVRPEMLNDEAKRLFNAIMKIADERDEAIQENKILEQAMIYMLQDLEVEKKGWTIEEMKQSYIVRAKSNGIFIKGE